MRERTELEEQEELNIKHYDVVVSYRYQVSTIVTSIFLHEEEQIANDF